MSRQQHTFIRHCIVDNRSSYNVYRYGYPKFQIDNTETINMSAMIPGKKAPREARELNCFL